MTHESNNPLDYIDPDEGRDSLDYEERSCANCGLLVDAQGGEVVPGWGWCCEDCKDEVKEELEEDGE